MSAIAEQSEVPPQMNSNMSPPATGIRAAGLKPPLYPAETKGVHTVCVTGATGYLGSNLVNRLLCAGHTVHGTVRSIAKAEELKKLPNAATNLKLFETDLFNKEGLKNAMKDCVVVFHTASPFSTKVGYGKKAQIALVDPAVKGTENVLGAVDATPTVKRVVMTSSTSSIVHSYTDRPAGQQATEEDWNTRSTLNDCPYNYSKTMAERKAHEIADKQSSWDLVCINPSVIFGPPVINRLDGESIAMVQEVIRGDFSKSCPVWGQGNVDVRDVAAAHCLAAFIPEASGRYIVSAASRLRSELVEIVADLYPNQVEKPKHVQPKFMASLIAAFKGGRDTVRANYGGVAYFSNEKSVRELGMTYISLEESIKDMCHKLEEMGAINPKK